MSVVEELRRNDPARTRFYIVLRRQTSDADLAQALMQNPFATDIFLDVEGAQADWNSLLRVIARRATLERVTLVDATVARLRNAPAALVRSILRAIQQNTAIRRVGLICLRLPSDISTFVDNASSITNLRLWDCDMEPGEGGQGARDLAAALQRSTNIKTLQLGRLEDIYSDPILEGLKSNVSVKTFVFSPCMSFSDAASHALQHLLESTATIQRFEFENWATFSEILFRPITQTITRSECVSELKFSWCEFEDQSSITQLQSILQNKRNLTTLCLHNCIFGGGQVHRDIISILLRPHSLLRSFEFQSREYLEGEFPGIQFENLLNAIEKSKVERLEIGTISTSHYLQTLAQKIPSMKLKDLVVEFSTGEGSDDEDGEDEDEEEGELHRETIRQDLLHAMKNNFTLRSVKAEVLAENDISDLFDSAEDKHRLAFYANRNESLDQWVDNPVTVEQQKLWPEALSLAERAGPDAFFRGLRSVVESDYVSLPEGRKRKRPQYCASS